MLAGAPYLIVSLRNAPWQLVIGIAEKLGLLVNIGNHFQWENWYNVIIEVVAW